ncbi:DUF1795 domain-containing protein [Paracoccus zhejiangensis]|uniref:DUF1795 domain-containing protein n=1 Tax=Paracoccus zhejiangensis TaxID=1077935 RepID=A0A2H5EZ94_9RHOB|nr:DUF1795 domain-containing protein [Paracoccus zhejiangensis]AUH64612.1 hypothetical protein CX676_10910 [Paracoccus zhejiangensis]
MYYVQEGSIELPVEWKDQSINIISASQTGEPSLSMTMTRDDIPWGMSFDEYVADQLRQAGETLKDFTVLHQQEMQIGGHRALQTECKWVAKQGPMHQLITSLMPGKRVLIITATAPGAFSDGQKQQMQQVIASFRPRQG